MKRMSVLLGATLCATSGVAMGGDLLDQTLNFQNITGTNVNQTVGETPNSEKNIQVNDFDNDGDPDVVIGVALGDFGQRRNKLYRNDGGVLNEVSGAPIISGFTATTVTRIVLFEDLNGDGWADLWEVNDSNATPAAGDDNIFINQHPGGVFSHFADETGGRIANPATGAACSGAAFDYDNDGDIDIYCGNYPNTSQDRMYFNDGNGNFTDVTNTHVPSEVDYTVDTVNADMNGDGKMDLLVANDDDPNFIYYNDNNGAGSGVGDFRYSNSTQNLGFASIDENAMVGGDWDNDGDNDIYWTNRAGGGADRILRNDGNDGNNKAILTQLSGAELPTSVTSRISRKATVADLNNDGRVDLFVGKENGSNGRPTVLRNASLEDEILFLDWSPAPAFPTGSIHDGWQGNMLDVDGDGDMDILHGAFVNDHLFENQRSAEFNEADLGGNLPGGTYNGEAIAVVGTGTVGEEDNYVLNTAGASNGFISVIVNGPDDYQIDVLNGATIIATSDRGGMGVEEAMQVTGINSGNRTIRVTILAAAGAGGAGNGADINGDGEVGPADLALLLDNWGDCPGCPEDINGDGEVGPADLALVLDNWGPVVGETNDYVLEVLGRNG